MAVERKLTRVAERLRTARAELAATEEQLLFWADEASGAETRGIVSDHPLDQQAAQEAQRTLANTRRHRDRLAAEVARLSAEADQLLDSLTHLSDS
jgi:hypothetical protein